MYKFRPATDRIKLTHQLIRDRVIQTGAAQKDPDSYRNLVVRIAGYSAYFVELNRDCQNDIIRRTENAL